jgi:hypothetical protein
MVTAGQIVHARFTMHTIELLESRIAPASLTGRVLSFTDVDGDKVTVAFSNGTLTQANFTFDTDFEASGAQQLQRIDVSSLTDIAGSNITVKVVRGANGDGVAHIGEIIAMGRDLGVVKTKGDVGKIQAGDNSAAVPGIKALNIGSYAMFDGATQPAGSNNSTTIQGSVPKVAIARDFGGGALSIVGSVTNLKIGGSMLGNQIGSEARLLIAGDLGTGTIGGSIISGAGQSTGNIDINGSVGTFTVRGALIGGESSVTDFSAQLDFAGPVKKLVILGDVRGFTGTGTRESIAIENNIGSLTIGGSVTALDGNQVIIRLADEVEVPGIAVGNVLIKGTTSNMLLAIGQNFGDPGPVTVDRINISGGFIKSRIAIGAGQGNDMILGTNDDTLNQASKLNSLVIKGFTMGTIAAGDSYVIEAGTIVNAIIGGAKVPVAAGGQSISVSLSGDVLLRDAV